MLVGVLFAAAVVLTVFGGLMAALDSALSVASRQRISQLATHARARRSLAAIADDPGAHQNAASFVRIVAETTSAVLVALAFARLLPTWWLALIAAALIMTAVSFVLVGVSPRSVGRAHADRLLALAAPIVHGSRRAVGPIADLLVAVGNRVTPTRARSAAVANEEQLLSIVDEATLLDVLEEDDRRLIHSIFEFDDTLVREVMVPRTDMVVTGDDVAIREALAQFLARGVSRVPVVHDDLDDVTGVLYLRDIVRFAFERPAEAETVPVGDLAKPAVFVPESKKADAMLTQMQATSNHLAVVVDEYGGVAGLVTLEDLIEELVGDISDEYDRDVPLVEDAGDGRFRVSARLALDELGDLFGLELDDEDVDTVGGLVSKALGRLPVTGSVAHAAGLLLTAERTEGRRRRLVTVLAERDPEAGEDADEGEGRRGADGHEHGDDRERQPAVPGAR